MPNSFIRDAMVSRHFVLKTFGGAHILEPTRSHYWDSYELLFAGAGQEWPEEDEGSRHLMVSSSVDGPDEKYICRGEYSFGRTYLSRSFGDLEDEVCRRRAMR